MLTIPEQMDAMESRIKHLESLLGIDMSPPPMRTIPTQSHSKHREVVMQVLSDCIPRNVQTITSAVSKAMGKKQNRGSINCMCSSLFLSGLLIRPDKGVYQKKAA